MAIKYKRKGLEGQPEDALPISRYAVRGSAGGPAGRGQSRRILLIGLAASMGVYLAGTVLGRVSLSSEPPVTTCRGIVVSKESRGLEGSVPEYALVVEIVLDDGRTLRDTVPVTHASWKAVASGAEVDVAYQLDDTKGLFRVVDLYAGADSTEKPSQGEAAGAP